jgi:hypothetical protein
MSFRVDGLELHPRGEAARSRKSMAGYGNLRPPDASYPSGGVEPGSRDRPWYASERGNHGSSCACDYSADRSASLAGILRVKRLRENAHLRGAPRHLSRCPDRGTFLTQLMAASGLWYAPRESRPRVDLTEKRLSRSPRNRTRIARCSRTGLDRNELRWKGLYIVNGLVYIIPATLRHARHGAGSQFSTGVEKL